MCILHERKLTSAKNVADIFCYDTYVLVHIYILLGGAGSK